MAWVRVTLLKRRGNGRGKVWGGEIRREQWSDFLGCWGGEGNSREVEEVLKDLKKL